jgi:very-short-patch-repair endonuclease
MTLAEQHLWEYLKSWKLEWRSFLKQKPIFVYQENSWLKRFIIADFVCLEHKLIIEIDWNIHDNHEVLELDKYKQVLLENLWFTIIRFRNEEVLNDTQSVLNKTVASFL